MLLQGLETRKCKMNSLKTSGSNGAKTKTRHTDDLCNTYRGILLLELVFCSIKNYIQYFTQDYDPHYTPRSIETRVISSKTPPATI